MGIERSVKTNVTPRVMSRILHAEQLISTFGEWPDFHDCQILSVALDRGNHMTIVEIGDWSNRVGPSLTARVMTLDDRSGERTRRLVTLRFNDINEYYMENFAYQNPVMGIGLRAEPEDDEVEFRLRVEWGGTVMGHEAEFTCESIVVLSNDAFDPPLSAKANHPIQPIAGSGS